MNPKEREELAALRLAFEKGDNVTQEELDGLAAAWVERIRSVGRETETLVLVDSRGGVVQPRRQAPRWLCHLLALRHRCAHVLLVWDSPNLGRVIVCQVRSWSKIDYPGFVDISVGGHLVGDVDSRQAALIEMREEMGVTASDLAGGDLVFVGGYDSCHESPKRPFFDAEWRDVYIGQIKSLDAIHFADGEVVGVYLCPEREAGNLLTQERIPIANGLRLSLPICLEHLKRNAGRGIPNPPGSGRAGGVV